MHLFPRIDPTKERILVVDDDRFTIMLVRTILERTGYEVIEADNGLEALEAARTGLPDLMLLNINIPGLSGLDALRMLREYSSLPVIMVTARGGHAKVDAFELGADDYVTKPFDPRELLSRIKAVLRRARMPSVKLGDTILKIDDRLSIDFHEQEVIVQGQHIKLTPTEYRLLYHLVENAGWTVPHDQLLAQVWGYEYRDKTKLVRDAVNELRKKIEEARSNPRYILTEPRVGYRFVDFRRSWETSESSRSP